MAARLVELDPRDRGRRGVGAALRLLSAIVHVTRAAKTQASRDCCIWVLAVVTRAFGLAPPTLELEAMWEIHRDADGNIPPAHLWGPVDAAVRVGIGERVTTPVPGRWHIVQRWGKTGHTFLWLAGPDGMGWVHESDRDDGPRSNGPVPWADEVGSSTVAVAVLHRPTRPT